MEGGREELCCSARNGGGAGRGRKFRRAVAGRRSRRSRSPVRHASSSPQKGAPATMKGRNMALAALVCKLHCAGTVSLVPTLPDRSLTAPDRNRAGVKQSHICLHCLLSVLLHRTELSNLRAGPRHHRVGYPPSTGFECHGHIGIFGKAAPDSFTWFFPRPESKVQPNWALRRETLRVLSGPADLGKRFATRDKLPKKGKEEGLAESA